jgi:GMP synthase-like glutamine amidotransferase
MNKIMEYIRANNSPQLTTISDLYDHLQYDNPVSLTKTMSELSLVNSNIKKWIFSGSAHTVIYNDSPKVPMEIFNIPDKQFLLICYSMESVLHQLKVGEIKKRYENKKEKFRLKINTKLVKELNLEYLFYGLKNTLHLYRNHHWYFNSIFGKLDNIIEFAKYRG